MENKRIVWTDWLRVMACFMVMVVHSTEPIYLGGDGAFIASASDAWWSAFFDSLVRSCVPLFVIASAYLQFPVHYSTGEFFRRRAVRILVPFVIWSVFYAFYWGEPISNFKDLVFNFNYNAGHLWFVYMLIGLYLIMPLLSPWAEKVGKKELSVYIGIWLFTTLIPFIRDWASSAPLAFVYGPTGIPHQAQYPLWGEASWNEFGTFYYVSGFVGYMLAGLWLRKFGSEISAKKSLAIGIPGFLAGFAITFGGFVRRVFQMADGQFPVGTGVHDAVWWETSWTFCSIGVVLMALSIVLMMKNVKADGVVYQKLVLPISKISYGMYLGHMVALAFYASLFAGLISCTPVVILLTAVSSYVTVAAAAWVLSKIPYVGKYIIG